VQKVERRFFGEEWAQITINIHKLSKKRKGEGAKGTKGVFGEIMRPNQTKYSQISEEKKKKGAKSTKGVFHGKNGPKSPYYEGKNPSSSYLENKFQQVIKL
jgi:hypothetical protein